MLLERHYRDQDRLFVQGNTGDAIKGLKVIHRVAGNKSLEALSL